MKQLGHSSNDIAYEAIKQRIFDMTYKMNQPLTEEMLASELSLSRTPIRQALQRLESEGFVEIVPYHGCRVREFTIDDIREIYVIRSVLEGMCASQTAERINQINMEKLTQCWAQSVTLLEAGLCDESVKVGANIHNLCIKIGGGRRIQQILSNLTEQIRRLDILSSHLPGRLAQSNEEHHQIVEAIRLRDSVRASQLMSAHILGTQADMINSILNAQDIL